jgi:hypothetical protein
MVWLGPDRRRRASTSGETEASTMSQQIASIAFCDRCEASTARVERGWRAYIERAGDGEARVLIACPACGEQTFGEDEAEWWD